MLEHGHSGDDTRLAADLESMHLHVGRDHGGREFGVSGSSCTAASDFIRNIVNLFNTEILEYQLKSTINDRLYLLTVLVCDDGTGGCSCIST